MVVVPGLTISNSGDYMGTVALVGKDDYNLKITGTISEDQKDDGYLYGNNAKEYDMVLTIKNISSNKCTSSVCTIEADDPGLNLSSTTNLTAFTISTLASGAVKTVNIKLSYSNMNDAYVDTGIKVTIRNPNTQQEWLDYIPLRFFKGLVPITIATQSPEENNQAALNGFIIYPDGNNQFFSVSNNSSKMILVPAFGSQKKYTMVFSGATVTSELSESTEMYYTVNPASSMQRKLDLTPEDYSILVGYMEFGGNNHSEENAYDVESSFQAYLNEGQIDYYLIIADGEEYYAPGSKSFCQISYESEYGDVPGAILIPKETSLTEDKLPVLVHKGLTFLGWYAGNLKVTPGYKVTSDIKLTAKWQTATYKITYVLYGGSNNSSNPSSYNMNTDTFSFAPPTRNHFDFDGWYMTDDFSGNLVTGVEKGSVGDLTLYAKWNPISYSITYVLYGGINSINNPENYTIETATIILSEPTRTGYYFDGWYNTEKFSGNRKQTITKGTTGNLVLYAKWIKECNVTYVSEYGTAPQIIKIGEGKKLTAEQLPTLTADGKYFSGWYAGEVKVEAGNFTVTDDVILTAKWSDQCTVSYITSYGIVPQSFEVIAGTKLTSTNLPLLTEKGWIFNGWYLDSFYTQKAESGYVVNSSITLYAKWEEFIQPEVEFVFVEGGTFDMGNSAGYNDEKPVHSVTLSSFYMSPYELTQGEYEQYCSYGGDSPSSEYGYGSNYPVYYVSWYDALVYCNKRSIAEGLTACYKINGSTNPSEWGSIPASIDSTWDNVTCDFNANGYRLPTEAEWEYAARGGINKNPYTYSGSDKIGNVAWYSGNSGNTSHTVGTKTANSLGIYDMCGNVSECCWDWFGSYSSSAQTNPSGTLIGSSHISRGGTWINSNYNCTVYLRNGCDPYSRLYTKGFRLVCSAPKEYVNISYKTEYGKFDDSEIVKGFPLTENNLPYLTEKGWSFKGWYTDNSYTTKVESGFIVNSSMILYAKWEKSKDTGDDFVFVEGGTFEMGSTSLRYVTVSSFYISPYELTQGEYEQLCTYGGSLPDSSLGKGADYPVYYVNWYEALVYCNRKSMVEGLTPCYTINVSTHPSDWGSVNNTWNEVICDFNADGYRLPTEAEWEYAARGGINKNSYKYSGSDTIDDVAWYSGNSGKTIHTVGTKTANSLGIYDMSGNVSEWCWDWYGTDCSSSQTNPIGPSSGSSRRYRGGYFGDGNSSCTVSSRPCTQPISRGDRGFRLVRSAPKETVNIKYVSELGNIETTVFVKGLPLTEDKIPTLIEKGWCFRGWYLDSTYTQKVEAGYEVNSSITLYAKWIKVTEFDDGFVFVEGGSFDMGNSAGYDNEKPVHSVTLSSFYMSPYELTQKEYEQYCNYGGDSPSSVYGLGNDYPAYYLSWYDALVYCNRKSIAEGLTPCYTIRNTTDPYNWGNIPTSSNSNWDKVICDFSADGYRLPTEAEWEYAARGGKNKNPYTYSGSNSIDDVAWYKDNSGSKSHTVGTKAANSLGIYDMSGNVLEWCWDCYGEYISSEQINPTGATSTYYRILHGGCWNDGGSYSNCGVMYYLEYNCAVSRRNYNTPYSRRSSDGFRLVRSAP